MVSSLMFLKVSARESLYSKIFEIYLLTSFNTTKARCPVRSQQGNTEEVATESLTESSEWQFMNNYELD